MRHSMNCGLNNSNREYLECVARHTNGDEIDIDSALQEYDRMDKTMMRILKTGADIEYRKDNNDSN